MANERRGDEMPSEISDEALWQINGREMHKLLVIGKGMWLVEVSQIDNRADK